MSEHRDGDKKAPRVQVCSSQITALPFKKDSAVNIFKSAIDPVAECSVRSTEKDKLFLRRDNPFSRSCDSGSKPD